MVQDRLGISEKKATHKVDETDANRKQYVETHYRRNWDDAANYHLIVNSGAMTHEDAASLIVEAARRSLQG